MIAGNLGTAWELRVRATATVRAMGKFRAADARPAGHNVPARAVQFGNKLLGVDETR